jgi:hypothetical protein
MDSIEITDITPIVIPSIVKPERILFETRLPSAIRTLSKMFMVTLRFLKLLTQNRGEASVPIAESG